MPARQRKGAMPHACALTQAPWLHAISPQGVGGPRCHFFSTFFANKLYKDTGYNYDQARFVVRIPLLWVCSSSAVTGHGASPCVCCCHSMANLGD